MANDYPEANGQDGEAEFVAPRVRLHDAASSWDGKCQCSLPQPLPTGIRRGFPIPDWSWWEVLPVATYLAFMGAVGSPLPRNEEAKEIREDVEVLRILQTHKYG